MYYSASNHCVILQGERNEHLYVPTPLRGGGLHHPSGLCLPDSGQHLPRTQPQKGAALNLSFCPILMISFTLQSGITWLPLVFHSNYTPNETLLFSSPSRYCDVSAESSAGVPVLPGAGSDRHVPTEQQQPVSAVLEESFLRVSAERPVCVSVHR